jgi:asparagine synthase (glutamine-hydrolysing)
VLDREAVALQSRLGAQLRQRTLYQGVEKTSPGTLIRLRDGAIDVDFYDPHEPVAEIDPDQAVRDGARALREFMSAYLDDHPEAVLQLTGGLDTRVLLAAVEEKRRPSLAAMTLTTPGSEDVQIAITLAERYGMRHQLFDMQPMTGVSPAEVYAMSLSASARVCGMADPLAFAAVTWAEDRLEQQARLSGSSGEIGRGLYFWGRGRDQAVDPGLVRQLAAWRMFANHSVSEGALHADFGAWSGEFAANEIVDLFTAAAPTMFAAADEVYLWQRTQRWSGILETAACLRRTTMSPMTDPRYLRIVTAVPPEARRGSRFLARLVTELDPELARIPMEGRPAPAVFADPGLVNRARILAMLGRKGFRKARQRLTRGVKPPLGADLFATRFVDYLREDAGCLDVVAGLDVFDPGWLEGLADGRSVATPADLALVVNLAQAFAAT